MPEEKKVRLRFQNVDYEREDGEDGDVAAGGGSGVGERRKDPVEQERRDVDCIGVTSRSAGASIG